MRQYRGRKKIVKSIRASSVLEKIIIGLIVLIVLILLCLIVVFPKELRILSSTLNGKDSLSLSPPPPPPPSPSPVIDAQTASPSVSPSSVTPTSFGNNEMVAGVKFQQAFSFLSDVPVPVPLAGGERLESWINETVSSIMVAVGVKPPMEAAADNLATVAVFPRILFRNRNDKMLADEKGSSAEKRGHSHVDWERVYKAHESFLMPTWATQPERNVLESASIFVSIAAFRDAECATTLKSLLTQARSPHRIYAGISEERTESETSCLSLLELNQPDIARQLLWGKGAPAGLQYETRSLKWKDVMGARAIQLVSSAGKKTTSDSDSSHELESVTTTTTSSTPLVPCTCEAISISSMEPSSSRGPSVIYDCSEDKNATRTECIAKQVYFFSECLESSDNTDCMEQHAHRVEECQSKASPIYRCVEHKKLKNLLEWKLTKLGNRIREEEQGFVNGTLLSIESTLATPFPPLFQCRASLEMEKENKSNESSDISASESDSYVCESTSAKTVEISLVSSLSDEVDLNAVLEVFDTPLMCHASSSSALLQCAPAKAGDLDGISEELPITDVLSSNLSAVSTLLPPACSCSTEESSSSPESSSPAVVSTENQGEVYMDSSYKKDTLTCVAGNVETAKDMLLLALHNRLPDTHPRYAQLTAYISTFSAEQITMLQQWFPIREGSSAQQRASAALAGCRFVTRVTPPESARGPTYGRYITSLLYFNQDYYMVVDSHSRFSVHWDSKMILRIFQLPTYGVLSHYPNGYTPEKPEEEYDKDDVMGMCKGVILANGMPKLGANWMPLRTHPTLEAFAAAGYIFGDAQFVLDTPFDPFLHYLFDGEEILYSVRMWTGGWDIYCPAEPNIFHHYGRPKAPKFWSLMNSRKTQIQQLSEKRALYLLERAQPWVQDKERFPGHEYIPPSQRRIVQEQDVERHPRLALEKERYGMGNNRSLEEFWEFSQLSDKFVQTRDNENRWEGGEELCAKQKE